MTDEINKSGADQLMSSWISLTFDDALDEHLDNVVPALNEAGLVGTFYAHLSAPAFVNRQHDWKGVAIDGHELGNHTVFHPADSRKSWVRPGNAIDNYSLDRMRLELEFANASLQALDGHGDRTFAYPCSNSFVGRRGWIWRAIELIQMDRTRVAGWVDGWNLDLGSTRQSYEPIVEQLFLAGRGSGLKPGQPVPPVAQWSRWRMPSAVVESWSLDELRQHVTRAIASGTWAILQFHGVGGGHRMECSLTVFRQFVSWLGETQGDRVITVREGASRLWRRSQNQMLPPKLACIPKSEGKLEECGAAERGAP